MPTERHISWDNFDTNFITPAVAASHRVEGTPDTYFIVKDNGEGIGIRVLLSGLVEQAASPLAEVHTHIRNMKGNYFIEISTSRRDLFKPFYGVMNLIADMVQLEGIPVQQAVPRAIEQLRVLLRPVTKMSEEDEIGLWGELWALREILKKSGPAQVPQWAGSANPIHDFRNGHSELEVKTTRSERRAHIINGLTQMVPSPRCSLYLLSIQLAQRHGEGSMSLPAMVREIRQLLAGEHDWLAQFNARLESKGWIEDHSALYADSWALRSAPTLFCVDDTFPRISPSVLMPVLGEKAFVRIADVHYRVDLTGIAPSNSCRDFPQF